MAAKRLQVEPLESRRLLAVILDSIPTITLDEGELARIDASFIDSTPSDGYTSSVQWASGLASQSGSVSSSPSGSNGTLTVRYDYRYDTSGFFTPARRNVLEVGAEIVAGRMNDFLTGFNSTDTRNTFTATFLNPGTGQSESIPNFSVGANEVVVFVGARALEGNSLAIAGAGGGSGPQPFFDFAISRGQAGAPEVDFAPWGGGMAFDSEATWHDGLSTEGLAGGENDLLSVVVHELGHVLGFTANVASFDRWVRGGVFTGPAATAANGGTAPPLHTDNSHWQEDLTNGGNEVSFDPNVTTGRRKLITDLDFAGLDDLGWELRSRNIDGRAAGTNTYGDNGEFNGQFMISDGGEQGRRSFRVNVRNVAPTLAPIGTLTVRANTSLQFNADFGDPGTDDTHDAAIVWGDGSGQEDLTVNQASNVASGRHVYSTPGTYQATIGVSDDDGAQVTQEFTVVVTPPPRGDWQNPSNEFDVNSNGVIDPLDALLVINELNERAVSDNVTGLLPVAPAGLMEFIDVTGDDIVSPQDALLVINRLSASGRSSGSTLGLSTRNDVTESEINPANEVDSAFSDFSMSWL